MPEGPEIRREADLIAAALQGQRIERIEFAFPRLRHWIPRLTGQRLRQIQPRGKALLCEFANGYTLYSHNQLFGQWAVHRAGDRPLSGRQIRAALHTVDAVAVLYSAAEIRVVRTDEVSAIPYVRRLGLELLAETTTLAAVRAWMDEPRFAGKSLGTLLLDQGFLAGLGNYLRSDILHAANLPANIRLGTLVPWEKDRLAHWALTLTRQSCKTRGITNDPLRVARLRREGRSFEDYRFLAYGREGLPCYQCGNPIARAEVGGRGWFHCPDCLCRLSRGSRRP